MEQSQLCLHPTHCHSFQAVSFLLPLQKCAACEGRLNSVLLFGAGDSKVVKCVACGVVAHRECALSNTVHWPSLCLVNAPKLSASCNNNKMYIEENLNDTKNSGDTTEYEDAVESFDVDESQNHDSSISINVSGEESTTSESSSACQQPQHLLLQVPSISLPKSDSMDVSDDMEGMDNSDSVNVMPLHCANHPFASVSRALQENITAYFQTTTRRPASDYPGQRSISSTVPSATTIAAAAVSAEPEEEILTVSASSSLPPDDELQIDPTISPIELTDETESDTIAIDESAMDAATTSTRNVFADLAEKVKSTVFTPLGGAAVAGSIAGGMAGFAIAGPAGAYAGWQLGSTGGALGVILEGSVSIGVFVASVAGAGYTAQHIQEQILSDRRVLTMGEDGTSRKVLLVRPNVKIDPIWNQIYAEIRKNAPNNLSQSIPFMSQHVDAAARGRYRRDEDIVKTDEEEISTSEKVLLLVSRTLSDKSSLSGYVYRELIQVFKDRCANRIHYLKTHPSISATSPRARRDDAHAVIKYMTATLLEVRPNFGASAAITELTATAVEGLVFGQLYNLVFEEIKGETAARDEALREKIVLFEPTMDPTSQLSQGALTALSELPETHSAVDKLRYCVEFLEQLSDYFLSACQGGGLCADSLLKMVCQHIIAAKVPNLNAEVVFLEEFARDEQLLRGREGYSLVTLQASLHFLNMSDDLATDILGQDNEEENVPVRSDKK